MTILFYIWVLLTAPTDKLACTLWVDQLPTPQVLINACGHELADNLARYTMQIVSMDGGNLFCEQSATQIYTDDCHARPLHNYRINLVTQDYQESICELIIEHPGQPTLDDINAQCNPVRLAKYAGVLEMRSGGTQEATAPPAKICELAPPEIGSGPYQSPPDPGGLITSQPYALLAGRLIWNGVAHVDCGGYSGIDPSSRHASACGVAQAAPQVVAWQNQFDAEIWQAAMDAKVPARLLKSLMGLESQFWPLWVPGDAGEVGLIQVTDDGADIALRYSPKLTAQYCPQAIDPARCTNGYHMLNIDEQQRVRDAYRRGMQCLLCDISQAVKHTRAMIPTYADTLAAFRCYAGEVGDFPTSEMWETTLAVYHAGTGCVESGICARGLDYINKIKRD